MRTRTPPLPALLFAAVVPISGCFTYAPAEPAVVPPDARVRVYLSVQEARRLEDTGALGGIDVGSPPALAGRLARRESDVLYLRVPVGARQIGFHAEELEQEIPVSAEGVVQFERRHLDRVGTGFLVTGGAVVVGAIAHYILSEARRPLDTSIPEPVNLRIPLLSIPVP